jgi:branched-chain amino acid transport system ATP-binding protein
MSATQAALELRGVSVRFGGVHAVRDLSLTVSTSQVHGLVGPNGSGKTTALNAVCGFVAASGEVDLLGERIDRMSPPRRMALGLGRTFQNPRPSRDMTVRDLLRVGEHLRGVQPWWQVALAPRLADRALAESSDRAAEMLQRLGVGAAVLDERLNNLSAGVLKMVDIARALMAKPRVLLLDEPTSGMNDAEIRVLHEALTALRATSLTLLLIEHNLDFMFDICDAMTVLDTGGMVATGHPEEVFSQAAVVRAYMGDPTNPAEDRDAALDLARRDDAR